MANNSFVAEVTFNMKTTCDIKSTKFYDSSYQPLDYKITKI